jgi:hypothetical protein
MFWKKKTEDSVEYQVALDGLEKLNGPTTSLPKYYAAVCLAITLGVGSAFVFYVAEHPRHKPMPLSEETIPSIPYQPPPHPVSALQVPRVQTTMYSAARNALLAAGVDEEKVAGPAADLEAAINGAIHQQTDELRFNGEIGIASMVPLWIIGLVALFRQQPERVDLSHLDYIVRIANRIAPHLDPATPFVWRR